MADSGKSYVEHVAVKARDIGWHLRFFREVLGMAVRETVWREDRLEKAWTAGGMQFNADPGFDGPEGRMAHLGIMRGPRRGACRGQEMGRPRAAGGAQLAGLAGWAGA